MKAMFFAAALALAVCGCTSRAVLMKPEGDAADLQLRDRAELTRVELLAVTDSTVVVESAGRLAVADLDGVRDVRVLGYETSKASKAISLAIVLISHVGVWSEMGRSEKTGRVALAVWTVGASVLMFTGDPQTRFSPPLKPKEMNKLRLFCRYPQGLSPEQQQTLLESYGQTEFGTLGE